ncbi:MFS transporter [Opitutus sp. GAS368]|uniref:MFS transporter n=1 Tax=Opitutus sp. GAS368 TaxID=1882749 RepID=UPI000879C44C|nr:MFS transporter [Opitutus sp. GAS368]SDS48264.1 Sugar phosphate permease [Opitutus sp. GAS368]
MSADIEPLPRRAWLAVALLWFVACLNYLDRLILITMRTSIKASITMTDAQFGLLTTVFLVTYGLLSPLGGFFADKVNRSRVIIFSLFAWSAVTWLTAHATSFPELLLYRSLMGISEACYFPAAAALLMDYHRNATRSLANGIHLSGVMVGSALGGLGGWIADQQDWTFVFEFFGIMGMLYSLVLLALLRDRPAEPARPGQTVAAPPRVRLGEALASLFSQRSFILALIFWGLLGVASWAIAGWLPTYLHEQFALTQGRAGLTALGYVYSSSLVGMVAGGLWADRWSLRAVRGRVWVGVIGCLVAVPGVLLLANMPVLGLVLTGMVIYGFARPFPDANMTPILAQIVDRRYLATGVGVINTFAVMAGGLTIYAGGALRDAHVNISNVFNFGAGVLVLCALLLWLINPRDHPANTPS